MKTLLNNRALWYDGTTEVDPLHLDDFLSVPTEHLAVSFLTPDIEQFNKISPIKITTKTQNNTTHREWVTPTIDVRSYVIDKLMLVEHDSTTTLRVQRALQELDTFEQKNMMPLLSALIFLVNTFKATNTVWGLGRGSSVASYVLFLIGVHDIDSVEYELDFTDFIR